MEEEIMNTLLEANREMPDRDEVLGQFKADFAQRLGARLAGEAEYEPEVAENAPGGDEGIAEESAELAAALEEAAAQAAPEEAYEEPAPEEAYEPAPEESYDEPAAEESHEEPAPEESHEEPAEEEQLQNVPAPAVPVEEPDSENDDGKKKKKKKKRRKKK